MPYTTTQVFDTTGEFAIDLGSLPHVYTYDGNGNLQSDTVWKGNNVFTKSYTYNGSNKLTQETGWVKQ